ncbi:lipocalin-like domain-containing protein [Dactylosporangium darangshiense]|uniref:lipocalin family protein n=1 Tax=Dactylosporangium darangshiense TaxID=579108 RepID=UPI0036410CB5
MSLLVMACDGDGAGEPPSSYEQPVAIPATTGGGGDVNAGSGPIPAEIVGTWSAIGSYGHNTYTFTATGTFSHVVPTPNGGVRQCTGKFTIAGGQITLAGSGGCSPVTETFALTGGTLTLGSERFVRDDADNNPATCIVGTFQLTGGWIDRTSAAWIQGTNDHVRLQYDQNSVLTYTFAAGDALTVNERSRLSGYGDSNGFYELNTTVNATFTYLVSGSTISYSGGQGSVALTYAYNHQTLGTSQPTPQYTPDRFTCTSTSLVLTGDGYEQKFRRS